MTRAVMWFLLGLVAAAAAVLSFAALRDLALLCGFDHGLAWMMPVVVDAGAAAGALIWLGTSSTVRALRFARTLTWVLLASSVAGNAVTHYLAAYGLRPAWWLVVIVSAVAPSVLGSTIHLAVLVGRTSDKAEAPGAGVEPASSPIPGPPGRRCTDALVAAAGNDRDQSTAPPAPSRPKRTSVAAPTDRTVSETRAAALLNSGAGRRRISRELDISEHQARVLLEQHAAEKAPNNGVKVLEDA